MTILFRRHSDENFQGPGDDPVKEEEKATLLEAGLHASASFRASLAPVKVSLVKYVIF